MNGALAALAAKGGDLFNDFLVRGMRNIDGFDDFFGFDTPDIKIPQLELAQQFQQQMASFFSDAFAGKGGFSPEAMELMETQGKRQLQRGAEKGRSALLSGEFGAPSGVSQQQIANLEGGVGQAGAGMMTNLLLEQEKAKAAAKTGAVSTLFGGLAGGTDQMLAGFPYTVPGAAGMFNQDPFGLQGLGGDIFGGMMGDDQRRREEERFQQMMAAFSQGGGQGAGFGGFHGGAPGDAYTGGGGSVNIPRRDDPLAGHV